MRSSPGCGPRSPAGGAVGLATSTNAARVLAHEGPAEGCNIAEFLGKIERSGELRRPVPLYWDDMLVLDEASQLATTDLAMVQEAARAAGARLVLAGDTGQLGAVEAGGMFRLLVHEVPAAQLHEVRRFDALWERVASITPLCHPAGCGAPTSRATPGDLGRLPAPVSARRQEQALWCWSASWPQRMARACGGPGHRPF